MAFSFHCPCTQADESLRAAFSHIHTPQHSGPPSPSENLKIQLLFNNATKPYKILFFCMFAPKNWKSNQARHLLEKQQLKA